MDKRQNCHIWFAVINVFAASKKAVKYWEKAESLMKEHGVAFHGTRTGKAGNAAELTYDACLAGYRKFIAVGGDGTVHDVLNGIAAYVDWQQSMGRKVDFSDFTMGVIPSGSGNDWIKSYGIGCDVAQAVDVISRGNLSRQDVVRASVLDPSALPEEKEISVSYMVNVGGVGIDARVCEIVNSKKRQGKRGKILYVTSLLQVLSRRVPSLARVWCDGKMVFEGAYLSMAFGIGKYSGGGMRQTPAAVMDDGLLDLTLIPDLPLRRIAREAPRLFTGTFLKVPELIVSKAKVMLVLPYGDNSLEPVEVDGEVVGKAPVRFEVLESQINIVVP